MVKLTALYTCPEDKLMFDEHYFSKHLPLAKNMPGLNKIEVTKFTKTPMGEESPYYMQADLFFENEETLNESMKSDQGKEAAKDIWKLASKITTMIVGEIVVSKCLRDEELVGGKA